MEKEIPMKKLFLLLGLAMFLAVMMTGLANAQPPWNQMPRDVARFSYDVTHPFNQNPGYNQGYNPNYGYSGPNSNYGYYGPDDYGYSGQNSGYYGPQSYGYTAPRSRDRDAGKASPKNYYYGKDSCYWDDPTCLPGNEFQNRGYYNYNYGY
jgi:hypothetical protein